MPLRQKRNTGRFGYRQVFEGGKEYRARILVNPNPGYAFPESGTTGIGQFEVFTPNGGTELLILSGVLLTLEFFFDKKRRVQH